MEYAPAIDRLDAALKREIGRSERIIWQGRPIPRLNLLSFGIWLFAVPWTAFSVLWTVMAFVGSQAFNTGDWGWTTLIFPLFGVPFIAVGLGMLSTPFFPLFTARKTIFAVTDRRLIRLRVGRKLNSETLQANRIGPINRLEGKDGCGTLRIAMRIGRDSDGDTALERFEIGEIKDVLKVEQLVRDLADRADAR